MVDDTVVDKAEPRLLKGSEWRGVCSYPDGQSFPFIMNILSTVSDDSLGEGKQIIEGTLSWESLNAATKIMGILEGTTFKFREYEVFYGEDQVEVPNNYQGDIDGGIIKGRILNSDAEFQLQFYGIRSPKDVSGMLALVREDDKLKAIKNKRKYNLFVKSSLDATTEQDRILAFKKLTQGADYWYDRTKKGELESRPVKRYKKEDLRKSCPNCGQPMFEHTLKSSEKIMACSNYPYCKPKLSYGSGW
eukprot:TRINITY_DN9703_c0_g2_i1.p1 TRINITY_DN9703_c0_g2~~TRINITY_DN9703_c0_g2_i1.p1  ORF type:complete len:272 (-),score=51.01 TRINITY_DN9703_c0_g2_i1:17-757(-)